MKDRGEQSLREAGRQRPDRGADDDGSCHLGHPFFLTFLAFQSQLLFGKIPRSHWSCFGTDPDGLHPQLVLGECSMSAGHHGLMNPVDGILLVELWSLRAWPLIILVLVVLYRIWLLLSDV